MSEFNRAIMVRSDELSDVEKEEILSLAVRFSSVGFVRKDRAMTENGASIAYACRVANELVYGQNVDRFVEFIVFPNEVTKEFLAVLQGVLFQKLGSEITQMKLRVLAGPLSRSTYEIVLTD